MSLIETRNLWQRRGERDILKDINLRVERGEVLALIGPTGAGKTTLLRLLNLLDEPSAGKLLFDGRDMAASAAVRLEARRRMAFILQKPVAFNASVYDNVAYGLRWRRLDGGSVRKKVEGILNEIDLSAYSGRNARTLSGGEMQRVAIARAVVTEPEVLLLDEPTANLDPNSASRIEELITDVIKRRVTTVVMATHDMAQGQRLADRIGVLMNGGMAQLGSSREVFAAPGSRAVAQFVGVENIIDGVVVASEEQVVRVDTGGGIIEAVADYAVGERVSACVRPEDITLVLARVSSSARNSFAGTINRVVSMGPLARVAVDCGFPLVALITRRSAEELGLDRGKQVYATFKATAVHVIRE